MPDDVVVAIIADRIGQPDAKRGFVLDGFPRTVPQAEALDRLLAERGLKLDGVIELKVDEGILLKRIENRVAEMTARGEKLRADDNPEVLRGRLDAYRAQTAPLADYYAAKGMLRTVDGMAPIDEVTKAIHRPSQAGQGAQQGGPSRARQPRARRQPGGRRRNGAPKGARKAAKKPRKTVRKAARKSRKKRLGQVKSNR